MSLYAGGSGTPSDPYIITTPQELANVGQNLSAHYVLANDLDMSGFGAFNHIYNFTGTFDGRGRVIRNITITDISKASGVFGRLLGTAVIKRLGVVVGTGVVSGASAYYNSILVGDAYSTSGFLVEDCFVEGNVTAMGDRGSGLVALADGGGATSTIRNCWGRCKCTDGRGHFIYRFGGTVITNCFYDTTYSGGVSGDGTGKTETQMKQQATYVGWDFTNTWTMQENVDYPRLRPVPVPGRTLAGVARIDGSPASGVEVRAYRRDTGKLVGKTVSTAGGNYTFTVYYPGLVDILAFTDSARPLGHGPF